MYFFLKSDDIHGLRSASRRVEARGRSRAELHCKLAIRSTGKGDGLVPAAINLLQLLLWTFDIDREGTSPIPVSNKPSLSRSLPRRPRPSIETVLHYNKIDAGFQNLVRRARSHYIRCIT